VVLLVAILVVASGVYFQTTLWEFVESFRVFRSRTLPYISGTFVGRETEVNDILQLLDFSESDTRMVSIDGPPGFGKSTLAIRVGHQMVRKGTNVLYINMLEVFSMQVLAEKVCKGADIVIKKSVRIERMYLWARDLSYNTLLILDNCDDLLQTQKDDVQRVIQTVVESSPIIKVLMTSRYKATLLDDSDRYTLRELSHQSACQLLDTTVKGTKLDSDTREAIANLTGNVPLALRVIGSLLSQPDPPSPDTIIRELKQQPIKVLSPEELPAHHQVYASIYLSYQYLHQSDQLCGQFLAQFPGSFDEIAAINIMPNSTYWYCLPELVQRSLLGYNQRTEHYEFHRLIKEFFLYRSRLEQNSDAIQHTFNVNFQSYFAQWLSELAHQFSNGPKSALGALDTKKHNVRYFLDGVIDHLELSNSVTVISAIITALDEKFLGCRFSIDNLHDVAMSATKYLQHNYEQMDIDPNMLFITYVKLVRHWAMFRRQQRNISSALNILTYYQKHIEFLHAKTDKSLVANHYIVFYSTLSEYYEALGLHHQVFICQAKILETTDSSKNCEPGSCNYLDIGVSYLNAGDNHQGVKYLELALQQSPELLRDELRHAHSLTWLHGGYTRIGATAKAEQVLHSIISLFPAIVQHNVTMQNKYMFEGLIRFFIKAGKHQEAGVLQEKILQTMLELHESEDQRTAQYAMKLALFLYSVENYTKAAEIGNITVERLRSCGLDRDLETARMFVLVGKSLLHVSDISGLHYFHAAINLIEEMEYTSNVAQEIVREACLFRMWLMDIKCIWKVSHHFLKSLDQDYEAYAQKAAPHESTSTAVAVYDQNHMFSVTFVIQSLPLNSLVQGLLVRLQEYLYPYRLVVGHYMYKFILIPVVIFILTCWPCLICVSHCCCCHCYYLFSRTWVGTFILLLPLLIGIIYYPPIKVLLAYYIIFISSSLCLYSFLICIIICLCAGKSLYLTFF